MTLNGVASAVDDRVAIIVAVAAMTEIVLLNEDIWLIPFGVWFGPAFDPDVALFDGFTFGYPVLKCPENGPEIL